METESREYKNMRCDELAKLNVAAYELEKIDERLANYVESVRCAPDDHNLYEVLAVIKFFRLMDKYVFLEKRVKRFVRLYECLKFSGMDGRRRYRLTPIQYFQFASILGFYAWEEVGDATGMPDKEEGMKRIFSGRREELRRLVREAILFVPRKFSKTTSTASLAVNELLFGDANAQAYTAANSYKQAKICFKEIGKIVKQLDPKRKYFKSTREELEWRQNSAGKESIVECLSGGADTKDGLNASLVIYDEYAQARYVKDHSVGAELLQVLTSSMGMRREPLTIIITTASRVEDGPFAIDLQNAKDVLTEKWTNDRQFASIFQPDAWEMGEESLGDERVWMKCNPHIGITVQKSYYRERYEKALRDMESMIEFKTKLLNIFTAGGINVWISQSLVRSLSRDFDIERFSKRLPTMVGIDLSVSDDFSVVVYNVYSRQERRFYIWLDCYIPELTLEEHPNKELYRYWISAGYMNVCRGAVISMNDIVEGILIRNKHVKILQIGYDAYKSQEVINALSSAIGIKGSDPKKVLKAVPQTYGAFTSPVESFEMAAKSDPPRVVFCKNPILPYCFGNCVLDEDRMRNKKPIKRKSNLKIDAVIGTLETFWLYNNFEWK